MNKNQFRKTQSLLTSVRRSMIHSRTFRYSEDKEFRTYRNKYHTLIVDKTKCNNERAVSQFSFEGNIQNVEPLTDLQLQFKIQDLFFS